MSPRRDPETGKFVAGGGSVSWRKTDRIAGALNVEVPAADNAGGTEVDEVSGEEAIVVDFDDHVDNDEMFRLDLLQLSIWLGLPTTASAESSAYVGYQLGSDLLNASPTYTTPTHWSGGVAQEQGGADVNSADEDADDVLHIGTLYGEAGHSDTVNALAGGAAPDRERTTLAFRDEYGASPLFDSDDELVMPMEIESNNVSDHGVQVGVKLLCHGRLDEV